MTEFRPTTPEDIPRLREIWKDCFGDTDAFLDLFFRCAYAPRRSLVLEEKSNILGAAYWFDCTLGRGKLAYVYAVGIDPGHQNRGLGRRLMQAIHQTLRNQDYEGVLLVPGDEGLRRYYEKFDYRTCSYRRTEAALPPMFAISPEEYARLRRNLLPENGVVQEGENLAFLAELAFFYQGESAIAALSKEDGSCLELLGIPGLGDRLPYAMGLSLTEAPLPEEVYFAFGFH